MITFANSEGIKMGKYMRQLSSYRRRYRWDGGLTNMLLSSAKHKIGEVRDVMENEQICYCSSWGNIREYEQYFSLFGFTLNRPSLKLLEGLLSI